MQMNISAMMLNPKCRIKHRNQFELGFSHGSADGGRLTSSGENGSDDRYIKFNFYTCI